MAMRGTKVLIMSSTIGLSTLEFAYININPGVLGIEIGSIKLGTTSADHNGPLDSFLAVANNLMYDIALWFLWKNTPAAACFAISSGLPATPGIDINAMRKLFFELDSACQLEYLWHGSLTRLEKMPKGLVQLVRSAYGLEDSDVKLSNICSVKGIAHIGFGAILDMLPNMIQNFAPAVVNKLSTQMAGNKVWPIIAYVRANVVLPADAPEVIVYMFSDEAIDGAPYISFHPGHRDNPMKNCSKKLHAYLAMLLHKQSKSLPPANQDKAGIFRYFRRDAMKSTYSIVSGTLPSLEAMMLATSDALSLPRMLAAERLAGRVRDF